MKPRLGDEATEFGRQATAALGAAGAAAWSEPGADAPARRVELEAMVQAVVGELGGWELSPHHDPDELEAAAALCRATGHWAVAAPVAGRLARPADGAADGLVVVDATRPAAVVTGEQAWDAVTLDGRRHRVVGAAGDPESPTGAFGAVLELEVTGEGSPAEVALGLVLPCWTLLGCCDRAMELTRSYVTDRRQFGQPLASFQGVQFQLTDAEVERSGLEVLAAHALWSIQSGRPDAVEDALACRLTAIEAARVVFGVTHQLHGAIGFCDETPLSWLSRASQPLRRLPFGAGATQAALADRLGRRSLTGLFGDATGVGES